MAESGEGIHLQVVTDGTSSNVKTTRYDNGEDVSSTEPYDPHKHRSVAHPTTNFETLVHLLKGSLGTGILAMPQAFYYAGLISGAVCTVLIGILCTYCLHVLVKTQYILCQRLRVPILTYPESMRLALEGGPQFLRRFARFTPIIVDVFMIVYQLGICCVYIVFVARNIKDIVDPYYVMDIKIHMLILLLPLVAINCIRNLKVLAPFSTLANVITFVGIALILNYVLTDFPPQNVPIDMVGGAYTFPLFFGTTLFALEAVGVVIALENNMKTPGGFGGNFGVLNIGMAGIIVLYVLMGMLGYIKYGAMSKASITLNLPQGELMSESVKIIFAIAIFITYALQAYVPVEIIWNTYIVKKVENSRFKLAWEYGLRIALVLSTFVLAVAIPRLGLFISLFGAFCLSALGIAFPAIMELCVLWPDKLGRFNHILIKDILLIIFGVVGLVAGTYTSMLEIILSFQPAATPAPTFTPPSQ